MAAPGVMVQEPRRFSRAEGPKAMLARMGGPGHQNRARLDGALGAFLIPIEFASGLAYSVAAKLPGLAVRPKLYGV